MRMFQNERIVIFAVKEDSGITYQHTDSTDSAAGSLGDSCTCIHLLSSDSHAGICDCRHTHPYLSNAHTHTQHKITQSFPVINQLMLGWNKLFLDLRRFVR